MICPVSVNYNQKNISKRQAITFGEGKASLYSDFDRTFLPATHGGFKSITDSIQAPLLAQYFKDFRNFLNNTRNGLKFIITTGRNFAEYETMAEMARERKFDMPLPDSVIVKNGSDEHIKVGTDEDFYKGGKFPFSYDVTNKEKEEDLRKLTGWDGPKIKAKVEALFAEHDFEIRHPATTNSVHDYGKKSLFSSFIDNFDPKNVDNSPISPWVVSFRQDGNLKMHIVLPKDMIIEDRSDTVQDIHSKMIGFFNKNNIDYDYKSMPVDRESGNHPCRSITPRINNEALTKLYDTQEAVKKAAKNNDLVIIAGDSSNDFQMLNPARYLREYIANDVELSYLIDCPQAMIEEMEKRPELAKKFQELPFVGIVVKNEDKGNDGLGGLIEHFSSGKYKKIIVVEEGHLLDGVKEAIKIYSEKKPEYMAKLSSDLKKEIFGIKEEIKKEVKKEVKKEIKKGIRENVSKSKSKVGWVIAGVVAFSGVITGIYLKEKKKSERIAA
ncbi:MAG: hypothetical protein WC517_05360 [Patescibacteria group bacterium]